MLDKNKPPVVVEVYADNGEHSHFKLIDVETGKTLWEERVFSKRCIRCGQTYETKTAPYCEYCANSYYRKTGDKELMKAYFE